MDAGTFTSRYPAQTATRIGSVSFLNAKPLIYGLQECDDVALSLAVPSALLSGLQAGALDVALLPVIDYQRMPGLRLLTSGGIGCDGPTLTVRLFSRQPFERTRQLACDTDSHTSVTLARIILSEVYGVHPEFTQLQRPGGASERIADDAARLLIGDKVICDEPVGFPFQLDLGEAWKKLTGLPFLFACWTVRENVRLGDLPDRLAEAKADGLKHVESILAEHAEPRGWPRDVARRYLLEYLKFDVGPRQLEAVRLFHRLAHQHGTLAQPPAELRVYPS